MRKMLFALVATLFASYAVMAQDAKTVGTKPTAQERTQRQLTHLTQELQLTPAQREQVAQLLTNSNTQIDQIRHDGASAKGGRKEKMASVKNDLDASMKNVLNADQYQRYLDLQQAREEKRKARREGRHANGEAK